MAKSWRRFAQCVFPVTLLFFALPAAARTWNCASATGDWFTAANWSPSDNYPQAGESVLITNRTVLLTNNTAYLDQFVITNATLVFSNWTTTLSATNVTVDNNGRLTHVQCNTNSALSNTNRVFIDASNVTIVAGGRIDVDGMGFPGGVYTVSGAQGPGGGDTTSQNNPAGAGHGGKGANAAGSFGQTYGVLEAPVQPGSGGGGGGQAGTRDGTAGGGVVRIQASGKVLVDGVISANGLNTGSLKGGGSGGSVYITCNTLEGVIGVIRAEGGRQDSGDAGGAGGGGRIAVLYAPGAQSNVNPRSSVLFSAAGGHGIFGSYSTWLYGMPGTLYFPDGSLLGTTLMGGIIAIPGFTSLNLDSLTVTNGMAGFTNYVQLTVTNNVSVTGDGGLLFTNMAISIGGNLTMSNNSFGRSFFYRGDNSALVVNGKLELQGGRWEGYSTGTNPAPWLSAGSIVVTNGATCYLFSGPTNGASPSYGMLISVTGDVVIASNAAVFPYSHPTNGGSVKFAVNNLTVATGGRINADAAGFAGGGDTGRVPGPFVANERGYGPGGGYGKGGGVNWPAGGGHGGLGGYYQTVSGTNYGWTYGNYTAPLLPGSGAGAANDAANFGLSGGGLVWIEATNQVRVDGAITANGGDTPTYIRGAGAGGAIYITCLTLQGTNGVLSARGGMAVASGSQSGAGGGGRIAVIYNTTAQGSAQKPVVQFAAAGGAGRVTEDDWGEYPQFATPGTIYLPDTNFYPVGSLLGGQIVIPGFTSWSVGRLSITNLTIVPNTVITSGMVAFPSGFSLTVSNDVVIRDFGGLWLTNTQVAIGGDLSSSNAPMATSYIFGGGSSSFTVVSNMSLRGGRVTFDNSTVVNPIMLTVGGNLDVTNTAVLNFKGGLTNGGPTVYGSKVSVAGDIRIADTGTNSMTNFVCVYSHPTNGGSVWIEAQNLIVAPNAAINANAKGYWGARNVTPYTGLGPGGGFGNNVNVIGGAGYGGFGGYTNKVGGTNYGWTYGSSNAPVDPGSGGGAGSTTSAGSRGGGLIHVDASQKVTVNGALLANSRNVAGYYGGGSGGGIYIHCRTFDGAGVVQANGANNTDVNYGSAGGGGRIAIWSLYNYFQLPAVNVTATNGTSGRGGIYSGQVGSIIWGQLRAGGTVFVVH